MTSSGLELPPDQNESYTRSILLMRSPVITGVRLVVAVIDDYAPAHPS